MPIAIGTEETLANVGDKVEGEVDLVRSARGRCQLRKGQIVTVTEFETHRLDTGIDHEGIAVMLGGEPSVPHAEGEDFPCIPIRRAGFHVKIGAGIEVPLVTLDMEDGLGVEVSSAWAVSVTVPNGGMASASSAANASASIKLKSHEVVSIHRAQICQMARRASLYPHLAGRCAKLLEPGFVRSDQ